MTDTGKVLRCDKVICVLLWCVMRPVRYLFASGRMTSKDAVAHRKGDVYSSTCRSSSGSTIEEFALEPGGEELSCTSSYASTMPLAGGK